MSYLFALGGVACTTKTTILKRLEDRIPHARVHLEDYKELHDKYNYPSNVGGMLFAAYRSKSAETYKRDHSRFHIFDRQPMEALVYSAVFQDMPEQESEQAFEICKNMGLCDGWKSLILRVKQGSENEIVKMMKKRNNGLDIHEADYVTKQNEKFDCWRRVMNYDEIIVDTKVSLDEQQEEIINYILKIIFRWEITNSLSIYHHRLPILKNKVAIFDLNETIMLKVNNNWQFKYDNIVYKFTNLINQDFTIVLVSNFSKDREIEDVCKQIAVPMFVMMSHTIQYKLPSTGFFEKLLQMNPSIDCKNSFFCGDNHNGTTNKDTVFAHACGIKFKYENDMF
ncbi:Nrk1 [Cryptophlebia peltastica nucleopolyhedrovirus]|uniref:Nrk1 n=1 Tax=Cryptophlebia peltastica nucleopolyhedrovirus TaxID=2304025 RepID=A0A346RNX0_9ABAC|nr:Nrk1 [Cryptophlebia peltastica nucleopolyhedrovirus]AXS67767.1 Nrk1 [Cryptophlebia peltastica nucleopolyhedrovirus]